MRGENPEYRYHVWTTLEAAVEIGCSEDAIIQAMAGGQWKLEPYAHSNEAGYLWNPRDVFAWWGYVNSKRGPGAENVGKGEA